MVHEPRYVRQKLEIALSMLNARSGPLGKRVRDAWEEMHVLDAEDISDAAARADYEHLQATRELFVVAPLIPNLSQAQLRDVSERIERIHAAVVR